MDGYKNVNPASFIFLLLTLVLFKTSMLLPPSIIFSMNAGTCSGMKNFPFIFSAPNFLYIDLKDTGAVDKWKPVYFDLSPNYAYDPDYKCSLPYYPTGGIDYNYFGGYRRNLLQTYNH